MKPSLASNLFRSADDYELNLCQRLISWSEAQNLNKFFKIVSRLGDGIFWYSIGVVILLAKGMETVVWVALTGLSCTLLYKAIKTILVRERPFITHHSVCCTATPLDRYSFPSGHTLHAVCFCIVFTYIESTLVLLVLPFALLVALSRVVLGLHYPSDVAAGAFIGSIVAVISITLVPF